MDGPTTGLWTSLRLDSQGRPHIAYVEVADSDVQYAYWTGTSWHTEMVATSGQLGWCTSLALDSLGVPRIAHWDAGANQVDYRAWDGSHWDLQIPDPGGWQTSLDLDSEDVPHIAYGSGSPGAARYAYWDAIGQRWVATTFDPDALIGLLERRQPIEN